MRMPSQSLIHAKSPLRGVFTIIVGSPALAGRGSKQCARIVDAIDNHVLPIETAEMGGIALERRPYRSARFFRVVCAATGNALPYFPSGAMPKCCWYAVLDSAGQLTRKNTPPMPIAYFSLVSSGALLASFGAGEPLVLSVVGNSFRLDKVNVCVAGCVIDSGIN